MIHAVVADDEVLARQKLRQLLRDERDIEIVGESATALETIELVKATNPELLFLDIRMPGLDGFDVLDALANHADVSLPRIIFTTA
jgi:two-component system LytT family response regulator